MRSRSRICKQIQSPKPVPDWPVKELFAGLYPNVERQVWRSLSLTSGKSAAWSAHPRPHDNSDATPNRRHRSGHSSRNWAIGRIWLDTAAQGPTLAAEFLLFCDRLLCVVGLGDLLATHVSSLHAATTWKGQISSSQIRLAVPRQPIRSRAQPPCAMWIERKCWRLIRSLFHLRGSAFVVGRF